MESKQDRVVEPEGKKKRVIKLKVPPSDGSNPLSKRTRAKRVTGASSNGSGEAEV
ncbi:hypothetical protein BT69DRAFT_314548 [Atractiella rhizophila]|nr:hypothetical protein BT69DRAFT_314548 [Atractiella rhizophila]